jgi:hypothetical protein
LLGILAIIIVLAIAIVHIATGGLGHHG